MHSIGINQHEALNPVAMYLISEQSSAFIDLLQDCLTDENVLLAHESSQNILQVTTRCLKIIALIR